MVPIEVATMLGSTLVGGVLRLWSKKMEAARDAHKMLMEKASLAKRSYKEAREYGNEGFQWTRRVIALCAVLSIIVLPKIIALVNPELPIYVGYMETVQKGWWIFSSSTDMTLWKPLQGLVITPLDTHLVSAITGLYFGGSLVGVRK